MHKPRKRGKIFYIADLHLFHENLINPRDTSVMEGTCKARTQFQTVEEMHELIRRNWNEKVKAEDVVYILGDLGLYHADEIADFLYSLNGSKVLIKGNHDDKNLQCSTRLRRAFLDIRTYDEIRDGDKIVVLFHYPIDQWDGYYRGYVHVHGHTHGDSTLKVIPGRYEACVEVTDYTPLTLKELMKNN